MGNALQRYSPDQDGSVEYVTGRSESLEYSYDPYGNVLTSTGSVSNPWGPHLGRWTQTEPKQAAPTFAYANDDPVNLVDTTGNDVNWGAIGQMALSGATAFLEHKGLKYAGKAFILTGPEGFLLDVGTNFVSALWDYRDVNAPWQTKALGIGMQTWLDTGVDSMYEGAFGLFGLGVADLPGLIIGSMLGTLGALIIEDNALNPCLKSQIVSSSYSGCPW